MMKHHLFVIVCCLLATSAISAGDVDARPNILIAISDDQSWPHASAYGSRMVRTPAFDRVAREGVLFTQAFCPSPGCSPSRAAFLTGLNTWQLEHAGTHASWFDKKYRTFPERLQESGYFVGYTGKGWGPGDFTHLGRTQNPAGPKYASTIGEDGSPDYASTLSRFLKQRPNGKPFCFWFGSTDAHRDYELGSGLAKGKQLRDAEVPPFLPDTPEIRRRKGIRNLLCEAPSASRRHPPRRRQYGRSGASNWCSWRISKMVFAAGSCILVVWSSRSICLVAAFAI